MPEWNNHNYEQMSPEELREILRADAEKSEQAGMSPEEIYHVLHQLESKEPGRQAQTTHAYERFLRHYLPCAYTLYPDDEQEQKKRPISWLRPAVAVLAVLLLASSVLAAVKGCELWGTPARWDAEVFSLETTETRPDCTGPTQIGAYSDFFCAMDELGMPAHIFPRELPKDAIATEIKAMPFMEGVVLSGCYQLGDGRVSLRIASAGHGSSNFVKDDKPVEIYERGGNLHYVFTNADSLVAVWMTDGYECSICGDLSRDELLGLIDSMYTK